jgi:cystathionine gamma-lyase
MTRSNRLDFATRCIHAGQEPDPTTGAVMMPIYATSTYVQQSPGVNKGYDYARTKNPTAWRSSAASPISKAAARVRFASGLAAISTSLECLDQGSHVISVDDLYGGSRRLFERVRKRSMGSRSAISISPTRCARSGDPAEHPARLGRDADQSAPQAGRPRARRRHRQEARHLGRADNTFASPYVQRPARAWLRPRRAFDYEVSQRPFRHGRRGGGRRDNAN